MTKAEILDLLMMKYPNLKGLGAGGAQLLRNGAELDPTELAICRNMFRYEGALRTWPGHTALGVPIAGESIMALYTHYHDDGTIDNYRMGYTNLQTYGADWTTVWELYIDTVRDTDITVAGTAVSGAAGVASAWLTRTTTHGTRIFSGDLFIMSVDDTGSPSDPWTAIATVNSDISITLGSAYTGSAGPGQCKFRKKFHGSQSQYPAITDYNGTAYITLPNASDYIKVFNPLSGILVSLTDAVTPGNVPAARGLASYADRIFAWGIVNGTYAKVASPSIRTLAWSSDIITDWTGLGSGAREFSEIRGGIKTCKRLDQSFIVYGDFIIYIGDRTGKSDPAVAFHPRITSPEKGLLAEASVMDVGGNRHVYIGQDDFYQLAGAQSIPIGARAITDFFYTTLNRDQLARVRSEVFDEYRVGLWLYCATGEDLPTHAVAYDYGYDKFYGPMEFTSPAVMVPGHFVANSGGGVVIDDLVGTIDAQTWFLGALDITSGRARAPAFGGADGYTYRVDDTERYGVSLRNPRFATGSFHLEAAGKTAFTTRVVLVYRRPVNDIQILLEISDNDFGTILDTQEVTLPGGAGGGTYKLYIDTFVVTERMAVSIRALGEYASLECFELTAEVVGSGSDFG